MIIEAKDVSIRYILGDFKDIGIKEYVLRKIKRNYHVREFWAVDGVSFTLERGDMLGIIGSNGAGKSTLLKAVTGIMVPTKGWVKVNAVSYTHLDVYKRQICGYDLQFVGHRETRPCQGAPLIRITSPSDFYMQYFWKSPNLWDKIYCRQMIEQRRVFFSGDVGEDLLFNLELLPHLKTAAIVQKVLYHYVQRKNSIIPVSYTHLDVYKRQM